MFTRIKNEAIKSYYWLKVQKYRKTDNEFILDLYRLCQTYGRRFDVFHLVIDKYISKIDSINENLYLKLQDVDRNILLRFFVKAFYRVDTVTKEELEIIDSAFERVRELYRYSGNEPFIEFSFRGKRIKYHVNKNIQIDDGTPEKILMNFYDVTHAFFLTEYEMEGFNPKDGDVIFDCGAAYGDTMLMFRVLYPNSQIHSFECAEDNINIIEKNKEINSVENVIVNLAFLYSDSNQHWLNTDTYKIDEDCGTQQGRSIHTLALDDYVREKNIRDIGLIKFDIEGGEQEALAGAINTIKSQKPLLYIPIYHRDSDIYAIPEFLQQLNMPMKFRIKWTEKKVWGVDCVLFVKFL